MGNIIEILLKFIAGAVGLYTSANQLLNLKPTFRSSIKADLEMLKMLEPSDPSYALIKQHIDTSIKQVYLVAQKPERKIYDIRGLIIGILLSAGFSYWTYDLATRANFSWWSLLTGFFALGGLGVTLGALEPKSKQLQNPETNQPEKTDDKMHERQAPRNGVE